jgi:hypothetical protein
MILVTNRDRNYQKQCPDLLLVRVWKSVEELAFGWNTKLKNRKESLDPIDYT